jgi:hypothetical protein
MVTVEYGYQDRQKHDLMAAVLKFNRKVNVVQKGSAQVGHFPTKEEDFHYFYSETRFI